LPNQDQNDAGPKGGSVAINGAQDIVEQLLTDGQLAPFIVQLMKVVDHILLCGCHFDSLHRAKELTDEAKDTDCTSSYRKVLVTGCFDWFHSGHVRFFEETAQLGDLYVVVGHDENVRLLKGDDHPLFSQEERRYMVGAIRFVKQALISTGSGWMDAEPEIEAIKPDMYVVNEDGDKPEKREFCGQRGLEYVVLKRAPAEGLPRRESTHLRGF